MPSQPHVPQTIRVRVPRTRSSLGAEHDVALPVVRTAAALGRVFYRRQALIWLVTLMFGATTLNHPGNPLAYAGLLFGVGLVLLGLRRLSHARRAGDGEIRLTASGFRDSRILASELPWRDVREAIFVHYRQRISLQLKLEPGRWRQACSKSQLGARGFVLKDDLFVVDLFCVEEPMLVGATAAALAHQAGAGAAKSLGDCHG